MVNEIIEAFQMACSNNPDLQMEDVEKIFIDEIENILPGIIKQINLPPKQTLLERRKEELYLKRMKIKYREKRVIKRTQPREILIEGLRVAQYRLNGHDTHSNTLFDAKQGVETSTNYGYRFQDSPSNFDRCPIKTVKDVISEDRGYLWKQVCLRNVEHDYKPLGINSGLTHEYVQKISLPPNIKIVVESSVKRKCKKDTLLKELIDIIKHEVVNIPELQNKNYDVKLSMVRDIELPEWEKLVVSFDIPELGFDEKMIMWDIIDKQVRKAVRELARTKHPYVPRIRYYNELNKNLFLKMKLT